MTMDILAGMYHEMSGVIDAVAGIAGNVLTAEMEEEHKAVAKEVAKAFEGVAEKKTEQIHTIITLLLVPVALLAGFFVLKLAYDLFTGTADKVGKGVGTISSRLKAAVAGNAKGAPDKKSQSSTKLPPLPKDPSKSGNRTMLLGQIIIRFVNSTLKDEDVENAVRLQKQHNNGKKIGEILVEQNLVTKDDVSQALKIQKKA